MNFPPKGKRGLAEEAPADFFEVTRDLLRTALNERHEPSLRRAAIRIDGAKFLELDDEHQERLLQLYASAMAANGAFAP
jgi:hypothetical protein